MREEGPPSGCRPEGLSPSNWLRPRSGGGATWRAGRDQKPVHHRVRGWQHLPYYSTLERRYPAWKAAAGGGGAKLAGANPPGGARGRGRGPERDPNTQARAQPRDSMLLGLPVRGPGNSCPPGHPYRGGPDRSPPLLRGGSAATVAGKHASLFPSLSRPPLTRHPFFLFFRYQLGGWGKREGGPGEVWAGASHLPASRSGSRRMAAVAAAAREEAVPRPGAQSAAVAAESGSGPTRCSRTESSGSRTTT